MKGYDPHEARDLFPADQWEKATASQPNGDQCVEWNFGTPGRVGLRDSNHPDGPVLVFDEAEWSAFQEAVKAEQTRQA
ncbi:hypothetical protein IL38_23800 [Actinopolyspora erythraea]|uniref:DUF397 domain-containing protein n=1 Tax=Actinopolyspora erythraea TaxID=414996 RepID=A0ABR4WYD2_9ACTN|nr:DUF397 domain-containing protein [Actinopolyspora erythraea]KGI79336.1 hypothetical protein IL38_23800 [Actinopolyspora erythraea]